MRTVFSGIDNSLQSSRNGLTMSVWELLLVFEIVLVSVVCALVFVGWRRKARRVSQAHSPEHRLKIPNLWTEIERVKQGGSTQMMRMKDGNFIMLSVDVDTTRVLSSPQLDAKEPFTELASFPVRPSDKAAVNSKRQS